LRLELLETVDEILFRANPLKLLDKVNVGCTTSGNRMLDRARIGRAVTMPAGTDEDDIAALDTAFAWGIASIDSDM
jgi:hypothetical protein